ncbi:MAG: hypothetical protein J6I48_02220 [Lachnospira sp.]|nr:hypothetical protein [Lachnospira sp.]
MEKILLFGTGKYFMTKHNIFEKYEVIGIIDNKIKEPTKYDNTSIDMFNPADIKDGVEKIFLMTMFFVSMWKQLVELGVNPNRIVYPYFLKPYFQSDSVVDEMVDNIVFTREQIDITCKDGRIFSVKTQEEWNEVLRQIYRSRYRIIDAISKMDLLPVSEQFATERGTPIDRYYIDMFLEKNSQYIKGDVLEIEDNAYTKKYGGNHYNSSIVMDLNSKNENIDFNANIETGEGIKGAIADCFICTQTLMYIYDLKSAAHNIIEMLKSKGVALITCSGLSQNSRRCMESYGAYWGFNEASLKKIFDNTDGAKVIESGTFGNVKTVSAHINGLCIEDIDESDFKENDVCYPLIVYAVVKKNE